MGDRSKNFSNREFACKCSWRAPHLPRHRQIVPPDGLVEILQDVRDHFGAPVDVHSGHRCVPYNEFVGGAEASRHIKADAADFTVRGVSPNEVQRYLLGKYPDQHGIGRYNTFTHVDTRGYRARWDNRR